MTSPGEQFRALHQPGHPFVLANAWDVGSARMLQAHGARAIATSSAAHAFTLGRPDGGHVTRDEALSHAQALFHATELPVQGDFENGFGHAPDVCAETVRMAASAGLAGICIEDINPDDGRPYARPLSIDRIAAAAAAARNCPQDFVLTARADGIMTGSYDIDEALVRLTAFENAGADCLYAPLPATMEDVRRICRAVTAPVNVLVAGHFTDYTLRDFADAGVARLSLGSALARATHRVIHDAGQQIFQQGAFGLLGASVSSRIVDAMLNQSVTDES